jgi:hypothetical protein
VAAITKKLKLKLKYSAFAMGEPPFELTVTTEPNTLKNTKNNAFLILPYCRD